MEWLTAPQIWIAVVTLTALELGVDNVVFFPSWRESCRPISKK
jgi:predicted tellurium resistance membrane protein TerC